MRMYSSVSVLLVLVAMASAYAGGPSTGVNEHRDVHRRLDGDAEYRTIRSASDQSSEDTNQNNGQGSNQNNGQGTDQNNGKCSNQNNGNGQSSNPNNCQSSEDSDQSSEAATTMAPTTEEATTMAPTTEEATTMAPTTEEATTMAPTTEEATTMAPTTEEATTEEATTMAPTTEEATTEEATTMAPTTEEATTEEAITMAPTTEEATTMAPTTEEATTMAPTTEEATTMAPTTEEATTIAASTEEATTEKATTEEATTIAASTKEATTEEATTIAASTEEATTEEATTMAVSTATNEAGTAVATTRVSVGTEAADPVSAMLELVKEEDMRTAMQILEEIITRVLSGPPLTLDPEAMLRALARLLQNTKKLPAAERVEVASEILICLDRLALLAFNVSFVDVGFIKMNVSEATFVGDLVAMAVNGSSIILDGQELQRLTGTTSGKIASFYLTDMTDILDDNDTLSGYSIDGPVLSTAVLCGEEVCNTRGLQSQVKITLRANPDEKEQVCRFWKTDSMRWSGDGCAVDHDQSTDTLTVCTCTHPSHIAVLLTPHGDDASVHFDLVSYTAVAISLVAMTLTVLIHTCIRSLWSPRSYVHVQLCLSLIAYQLVFVTAIDKTHNQIFCSAVAVALQYLYMAAFLWLLMEGVVLCVGVIKTSRKKKYCTILTFTILSYGLPALYLSLALALRHLLTGSWLYTRDARCWLGYGGGFMWVSISPVLLIVMGNIVVLLVAMAMLYRHSKRREIKSEVYWLKCFAALVVVMGLCWSVGTVLQDLSSTPLLQASTLCMAFQGLAVFSMLVLFPDQVRRDTFVNGSTPHSDTPPHQSDPLGVRIDQLMHSTSGSQRYSKSPTNQQSGPLVFPNPAYATPHNAVYKSLDPTAVSVEKGEDINIYDN